jgi:hypothetical protein
VEAGLINRRMQSGAGGLLKFEHHLQVTPTFGLGLIEAITDSALQQNLDNGGGLRIGGP